MSTPLPLSAVCRLPAPDDNVAIAIRRLDAGTRVEIDGEVRTLASCVLEGHRLAVRPIAPGEALLSWGLPFGHALVPIAPGDYVCNASILQALAVRQLGVPLPSAPNFADYLVPFTLDPATYRPGQPVDRVARPRTFRGYRRAGGRGIGTRNTIVILGTTSRTASVARQLASRLQPLAKAHAQDRRHRRRRPHRGRRPRRAEQHRRGAARAGRLHGPPERRRDPRARSRRRADHQRAARGVHARARAAARRTCGTRSSASAAAWPRGWRRARRSSAAGSTPSKPTSAPRSRWPACGSRCSAAARTPSPACPATRSPAPSCTS